jgi:hypothetical protein
MRNFFAEVVLSEVQRSLEGEGVVKRNSPFIPHAAFPLPH